jgi:hypothetical protein
MAAVNIGVGPGPAHQATNGSSTPGTDSKDGKLKKDKDKDKKKKHLHLFR